MCSTLIAAHALQKGECGNHFLGLIEIKIKVLSNVRLILPFPCFTDQKSSFYQSSIQILNVQYSDELSSPATEKYRTLSGNIESMVS